MGFMKYALKGANTIWAKHSAKILTGMAVGGTVAVAATAIADTKDADDILANSDAETFGEKFRETWKCYIPTTVAVGVTVASIFGLKTDMDRRTAMFASLATVAEEKLREHRRAVREELGEERERKIHEKAARKRKNKVEPVDENVIGKPTAGDYLIYDEYREKYFWSTEFKIRRAENEINRRILTDIYGEAVMNEFYELLHVEGKRGNGTTHGWNTDNILEIYITYDKADEAHNEIPCAVMCFKTDPVQL